MAVIVKASTAGTTNLSATAAWVGGVLPVGADIAVWDASSLTGTQTLAANPTWGAIRGDAIAGNLTINPSGANRILTLQGYLDGGEEFLVDMSSAASGRSILLLSASGFTATLAVGVSATAGVIDVNTGAIFGALGSPITGSRPLVKRGGGSIVLGATNTTTTAFTSPIDLQAGFALVGAEGATLANYATGNGTLTMSAGTTAQTGNTASGNTRYFSNPIVVNGDVTLGAGGSSATGTTGFKGTSFALGGTTKTLTIAGSTRIDSALTGTAGFTKAGAGTLTVAPATGTNSGLTTTPSAPVSVTAGTLQIAGNLLSGMTDLSIGASGTYYIRNATADFTFPAAVSGAGVLQVVGNFPSTGVTFAAGNLTAFTGTLNIITSAAAGFQTSIARASELPNSALLFAVAAGAATPALTSRFYYLGAGTVSPATVTVDSTNNTSTVNLSASANEIYANGSGALEISGNVTRTNSAGTATAGMTLTLRGTNTGDNKLSGVISNAASTLALAKADASRWVLSGANTYTGATSISAGTLSAQNNSAFGSSISGAVTQTGGTIDISGGVTLNKGTVAANTVGVSGSTALTSTSGNNEWIIGAIAMNSTTIVDIADGARLKLNNSGALSGVGFGVTKNGTGELELTNTDNTFTGAVTVAAGTLTVTKLANSGAGVTSSIGTGAGTSAISLTGTLKYIGTGHSTNRSLTFTGAAPALDASGSGAVTYSAATQAPGARTITFTGSSTAANTLSAALSDGTGAVSVAKSGEGKWVLSNATVNYTGTTTISAGTLNLGGVARTLSGTVSISGGTLENSTSTVSANVAMTGGTITAQLTGNKTLDVDSGIATLEPINNVNDFSGNTTVDAGATLQLITGLNPSLGSGRVLGTSDVSVSGNLRTKGDTTQKGQMRYGGNLTFQTGAKLYVGSLA